MIVSFLCRSMDGLWDEDSAWCWDMRYCDEREEFKDCFSFQHNSFIIHFNTIFNLCI